MVYWLSRNYLEILEIKKWVFCWKTLVVVTMFFNKIPGISFPVHPVVRLFFPMAWYIIIYCHILWQVVLFLLLFCQLPFPMGMTIIIFYLTLGILSLSPLFWVKNAESFWHVFETCWSSLYIRWLNPSSLSLQSYS